MIMMAVPEQMPQPLDVGLRVTKRGEKRRFHGAQAAHDLLDMVHAHGEMKPIQNILYWAARGRAHQESIQNRGVLIGSG